MKMKKTLFLDTNLDTHFALLVSYQDTVSDLKGKILAEHPLCFPSFGDIKINALKVKRKGCFYHLTDHLILQNVFYGVKKDWYLSVDASGVVDTLPDDISNKASFDDDSKLKGLGPDDSTREVLKDFEMQVKHVCGDHCKISSADSSEKIQEKCDLISKENEMLRNPIKYKMESSSNVFSDLQCHFPFKEDMQNRALSIVKNKKKRKFESPVESSAPKVNIGSFNDTNMGNKHITDEAQRDGNRLKEWVVDLPANTLVEESVDARTATKRRRKISKKSEDLIFDSSNKEKKTGNKSKQKPSYSNNDAAVAVPSCLEDIREENTNGILEGRQDFGKLPEKVVEDGDSVIVQEAVTVPQLLSQGVLIDIGTNEAEAAKSGKENESVDPKVMLLEKSMKELVNVPANILVGESPDAHTTTKKRRKINKKSEDLIFDSSNKEKKTEKKSKQKLSYSNNDATVAVPSYLEDNREENTMSILEGGQDFGKEPDEGIIHEKIVEDGYRVTVQEAVTVPEILSQGVLIDIGTNEAEAAKSGKENESVDPKVMLLEKSMKEGVNVPANILVGKSPDERTTAKKRRKINKKSEDLIFDSSNKEKKMEKKSKQKPSYSNYNATVAVPSCLEDIREENTKAILEGRRDFAKEPNEGIIHEKIVEDEDIVIVQEAVTVPELLSQGVLIDIGTNEAKAAKSCEENESVDPKVMLLEKSMKEVVNVPANTLVGESPDARTTAKKRRKINKKSEDLIFESSNKEKKTEKKSKQKPSYSNNDAAVAVPSCLKDIREENMTAMLEGRRDFGDMIHEKIVENGDSVIVQEAVTVLEVLSHGVLIDVGTSEVEAAKKENESVDPKVMLLEKSMKEVVDVPASIPVGEFPDARTTTKKRRKINKKSEDLICDISNKDVKTKKSKQKPSYSNNDAAVAVPSCLEDTREESRKATLEGRQNFVKGPDEVIIYEKVLENASLSENHSVTVQETVTVHEVLSHGTNEIEAAKTDENDLKVVPQENSMKEVVDPSILLEGNSVEESGNMSGRGKRVKKTKNTKGKVQLSSEMEYSVASGKTSTEKAMHENAEKSVQPMHGDKPVEISENQDVKGRKKISSGVESFSDVQMKEQDAGRSIEKTREAHVLSKKIMKRHLVETSSENLIAKGKVQLSLEMDNSVASGKTSTELKAVHGNVEKSVQPEHVDKPVEILENQDGKGRKKIRKKNNSGVESFSDMQMGKQVVDHLIEKTKKPHVLSKKIRKPNLVETSSENLINSILQSDKDTVNKSLSLQFEAVVDEYLTNGFSDETNKKIVDSTTSHGDGDIIKASDIFLPSLNLQKVHDSAVAFDNKVIESSITVRRVEAKKNSEESGVGNSSTIQGSLRENDKSDKLMPCLQKGSSKVSENKKAAQRSTNRPKIVKVSTAPGPSRLNVNEIGRDAGALTSSSEISSHKNKSVVGQKRMTTRSFSAQRSIKRKIPDVKSVERNISKRGKSLLAISSNVFKHDNGHNSEEDGLVDSDVSTQTPSDNLSSSDDSEDEDVAGSQDARRNVNDNNDLESILRSSSRFKKAMITASQTPIEDMDGLLVDYVPDSQPNI